MTVSLTQVWEVTWGDHEVHRDFKERLHKGSSSPQVPHRGENLQLYQVSSKHSEYRFIHNKHHRKSLSLSVGPPLWSRRISVNLSWSPPAKRYLIFLLVIVLLRSVNIILILFNYHIFRSVYTLVTSWLEIKSLQQRYQN